MQEQHQTEIKAKLRKPSQYKVLLLNDDFTPMDFVVDLLETIFHKNQNEAAKIMFEVHEKGSALCGICTFEVAETKLNQTLERARQEQHPLQCRLEKV
jgi:ATP-dependent Clp protease adaptor protein ClpS